MEYTQTTPCVGIRGAYRAYGYGLESRAGEQGFLCWKSPEQQLSNVFRRQGRAARGTVSRVLWTLGNGH